MSRHLQKMSTLASEGAPSIGVDYSAAHKNNIINFHQDKL